VGGILAGLNQIRLGFGRKAWREFLLSLFAFIWYSIYFFVVDQHILAGALRIFPLAIFYSARLTPVPFLLFLAIPFAIMIWYIAALQNTSWKQLSSNQVVLRPWWSAYLLGVLLMLFIGLILMRVELVLIQLVYY
jgi:hypothetical protein